MNIDLQAREITPLRKTYAHVARYIGGDKVATRYQEATLGAQPMANFHYRPTWDPATSSSTRRAAGSCWPTGTCCGIRASSITRPGR